MSEQQEKIFADGFIFKQNPKAPEFVIGKLSVKVDDAIAFLKQHENKGWVNFDVKKSRSGNTYMELDTYRPPVKDGDRHESKPEQKQTDIPSAEEDDDLPF